MAWFKNGKKYWKHNGKIYSKKLRKRKFESYNHWQKRVYGETICERESRLMIQKLPSYQEKKEYLKNKYNKRFRISYENDTGLYFVEDLKIPSLKRHYRNLDDPYVGGFYDDETKKILRKEIEEYNKKNN